MATVCLDCRYIHGRPSGIGRIVQALVNHLPRLAPDLHFRFLRHGSLARPLSPAANVSEFVVGFEANGPVSMWLLPQALDLSGIDLFHAPSNILPRGLGMPCVTTIHDTMWLDAPALCGSGVWHQAERHFYRHGLKRALRRSDAILTVSEATRGAVLAHDEALSAKTFAVHPGVPPVFRPGPADPELLARWGLAEQSFVLTVGQFAPYKNHENAIRGFSQAFADRSSPIVLAMVQRRGRGPERLRKLAESLGIGERVRFLPPLADEELASLYRGALALLHPSLCEGFGMPLVEAMACGCPVVTSDISAMPEVAGGAARLVDPRDPRAIADALSEVVGDAALARELRERGLERARAFDPESFAKGNLAIYRKVLAGS